MHQTSENLHPAIRYGTRLRLTCLKEAPTLEQYRLN
jgi:hypothetical protein